MGCLILKFRIIHQNLILRIIRFSNQQLFKKLYLKVQLYRQNKLSEIIWESKYLILQKKKKNYLTFDNNIQINQIQNMIKFKIKIKKKKKQIKKYIGKQQIKYKAKQLENYIIEVINIATNKVYSQVIMKWPFTLGSGSLFSLQFSVGASFFSSSIFNFSIFIFFCTNNNLVLILSITYFYYHLKSVFSKNQYQKLQKLNPSPQPFNQITQKLSLIRIKQI
ncbi:transmembrane protein, putative (macronuclear) [Tetrahymena thermophila SB210]|uniref:Transmembrane protein, putative n=1 Tax=Tetrahymena thermophila (strain SB210) TaxID=312017 RepID=W7XKV2_TETTS|nr:transmembrane protein, putative [Tetrahymena thermophila SB210]EWS75254.1 transmembrane protein, putative [Tetrahymena thermophila SB210]|eukprot:XP_012652245.1 transmembrane protein, putative [Tetrahymena thermophila SB210]